MASSPGSSGPGLEFEALYNDNYGFVWRSLLHFGLSEMHADDAAQEVFLIVYRRLDEFDPSRSFKSWVYGVARRVASSVKRSQGRTERRHNELMRQSDPPDASDKLETKRRVALVESALAELPTDQRDVFVLAEIEGLSAPEISDALDVKLNTVYSRLRLARKRFTSEVERLTSPAPKLLTEGP